MDLQVAIVVVSYNTRALLLECLASAFDSAQAPGVQVVVVDNASEDGSYETVRDAYPQAILIRNPTNLGFGVACNQGIKATRSRFVLLLNSDARLTAQAFRAMTECLAQDERCAAAGCRLIDAEGREGVNVRNFLTPLNQALELAGIKLGTGRLRRTRRLNVIHNDCSVDWIAGACLMLRRAALDEAGLFDEQFFMYSEDEDLCIRLRKGGWLVCFCGGGTAVHHGSASSRLNRIEMLRQFYLSQMRFLAKHRGRRSSFFYEVLTKTVLVFKKWLQGDSHRRDNAEEQLNALKEAARLARADRR
jgi:GT2 family glycosyltransferase